MTIEVKTETRKAYKVDGVIHETLESAQAHTEAVRSLTNGKVLFKVNVEPDLTEGRRYYGTIYVAADKEVALSHLFHWLYERYGSPVVNVMGVSPIENYRVYEKGEIEGVEEIIGDPVIFISPDKEKEKKENDMFELLQEFYFYKNK